MIPIIHYCRGLAAIFVVLFHASKNLAKDKYFGVNAASISDFFSSFGTAGVSYFFVLSGFIIATAHIDKSGKFTGVNTFFQKRFIRVYPPYIAVFAISILILRFSGAINPNDSLDFLTIAKSIALIPQDPRIVGGTGAPIVVVAWSLQYEIVFYTCFGLAMWQPRLTMPLLLAWLTNFVINQLIESDYFFSQFLSSTYTVLFLLGVGSSILVKRQLFSLHVSPLTAYTAGILIVAFTIINPSLNIITNSQFIITVGILSSLTVIGFAQMGDDKTRISRIGNFLGDVSYSLYLVHFQIVALLSKIATAIFERSSGSAVISLVAITIACIVAAGIFSYMIERPMIRWFSKWLLPRKETPNKSAMQNSLHR